ncbi:extracellular solute-binding protein [Paenibacillus sp. MAH-36]|uniref:Extracellular solute-binding protein n=1 Tax=Paenibacillus violae TaxID=3077234 RepID=A0ABU3R8K2_9BACL|nr:extracellular solute-binding protein [Paenibacillus sp. PFR10]MDU0200612.1 extracellular solute-binding protein [Paenibacillus sp. PFR10]
MSNQGKVWSYSAIAAILAVSVTLAGCSKAVDPVAATTTPTGIAGSAAPTSDEPYELKWLKGQDISKPYDPSKDLIMHTIEKKLNIKIVPEMVDVQQYKTKLNLKMSSGDIPDVVRIDFADDFQKYAQQGAFYDLTNLITEKDTRIFLRRYLKRFSSRQK